MSKNPENETENKEEWPLKAYKNLDFLKVKKPVLFASYVNYLSQRNALKKMESKTPSYYLVLLAQSPPRS